MPPRFNIPSKFNIAEWFLDRPAAEHPDRVAILGEPSAATYGELRALANRAGNALQGIGCAPGDRVLLVLRDSAEFIAAFFGAAKIGAIAVPVNSFARAADFSFYLADSGASIALVDASALGEFRPAVEIDEEAPKLIVVGGHREIDDEISRSSSDAVGGAIDWAEWIASGSEELDSHPSFSHDPAFLLYTSGSGGRPKAAVHQHKDMLAATRGYAEGVLGTRADDRMFSVSKLFFAYGLGNGMYFPLSAGASTVLNPEKTRVDRVAELLVKHRPTIFFGVPTFYAALLQEANRGLAVDFTSVRLAVSAGEPLPAEVFHQCRERFGLEILDGIGSTEMLHIFISNRPGRARAASCGTPVPGYEVRITGDDGRTAGIAEIGNLAVRGESALAEYWRKPELSAGVKPGEWVATGDKFLRDADGYYHYAGRSDDMIKVSGMWVSPVEVENALLGDERVAEAAVIGVEDRAGLIKPVAYVILAAGFEPGAGVVAAIREAMRAKLVHYKCPREIYFVDDLPKTVTGKIQRYLLRDRARAAGGDDSGKGVSGSGESSRRDT
ncbi:MAG TPA: benzoate-CoA ligase family protein [Candidatus Acidoferrales bacterium]|nr:benzoate-CoA ligase family protein [Candidatus Acidoferrales bacterium]